jgi:D-glycero-beta-D-manno-heptose-7-phosphate kinase
MTTSLLSLLPSLSGQRLIVLGDVFLDDYLIGRAERLSREAPIPVLAYTARRQVPGGGANPAMNAAALGASVSQVGVVGTDPEAAALRDLLAGAGIDTTGLISDSERPTVTKIRIVAEGELRFPQQLARLDKMSRLPLSTETQAAILAALRRLSHAPAAPAALLVSDYRSGLITPALVDSLRELAAANHFLLTADTQGDLNKYHGFDLVKCNRAEAESFLGQSLATDEAVAHALFELNQRFNIQNVLITRGGQGLSLGIKGAGCTHIPTSNASEVYDITGAGDTVIAIATLALVAKADPIAAAQLANAAAGLVVRKWGNATVTLDELRTALS